MTATAQNGQRLRVKRETASNLAGDIRELRVMLGQVATKNDVEDVRADLRAEIRNARDQILGALGCKKEESASG